jgi:drug/metabolite transporter (DMT)-like permease
MSGQNNHGQGQATPGSRRYLVGIAMLLAAALCFASHNVFTKLSYDVAVQPSTILAIRSILALGLFAIILGGTDTIIRVPRTMIWLFLITTFFNLTQNFAILTSFEFIPVSLSILILYLFPIIVAIFAITLGGERASLPVLGAAALGFAGVALVLQAEPTSLDWRGLALAGFSAFALATNVYGASVLGRKMAPLAIPFLFSVLGAPLFGFLMIMDGGPHWPTTAGAWVFVIAVVSLPMALILFYAALPRAGAPRSALVLNMEPLLTVGLAAGFANEFLAPLQLVGGGLIVMAIFWIALSRTKPAK